MGFSFGFIFATVLLRMAPLFFLPLLLRPSKAVCSESHTAAASDMYPYKDVPEKNPIFHGFSSTGL